MVETRVNKGPRYTTTRARPRPKPARLLYIFDLDRTLYPLDHPLLGHMAQVFQRKVHSLTSQDFDYVSSWIERSFEDHNRNTFRELSEEFGIKVEDLLTWHEDMDYSSLMPCHETRDLLQKLPALKRVVYTDSTLEHTRKVLAGLGISDLFEQIYDIRRTGYTIKRIYPHFEHILHSEGVDGRQTVMIEDTAYNLRPAKAVGMRTVHITPLPVNAEYIDESWPSLIDFLRNEVARHSPGGA